MKFFIDTANIEEIKKANEMGMADGLTANPTLVSREGREFKGLIKEICDIVDGPVSGETDIGLGKFLADWRKLG